jgi:hypothetical protein
MIFTRNRPRLQRGLPAIARILRVIIPSGLRPAQKLPEIVLVCNEDAQPMRLQRIKHLPLQCLLNFYSNNHNTIMPIRIELNENVNVIH